MTGWMLETLVWTGLLIALVLLIRRPVGRYLGAKAAYALWLLPFLRLLMPPLVLPSWLAPAVPSTQQNIPQYSEIAVFAAEPANLSVADVVASAPAAWGTILMAVWLTGAAVFLAMRFSGYFKMRRRLLADGRPVGEAGNVRLLETPATASPLAFGVIDKVIALPLGFMALHNREQRDFVLAHELAHHSAHDLLANMAAQPLFALHWFNPLAWLGWRAMRRDQEAACDARVIAERSAQDKATYAQTIANFAAGSHASLAAPMACPVLGEKSIIHRLRSLSMSDISARRRFSGRALIGASLLALPLTASISYAENNAGVQLPEAPSAPAPLAAPAAPQPPAPPLPPSVEELTQPGDFETVFDTIESADDGSGETRRTVVMRSRTETNDVSQDGEVKRVLRFTSKPPADGKVRRWKEEENRIQGSKLSDAERAEVRRDLAEAQAEVHEAWEARHIAVLELQDAKGQMTKLTVDCKDGKQHKSTNSKGQKVVHLCTSESYAQALTGLKQARKVIASNQEMTGEMRAEVLAALDEQIAQWKTR